MTLEKRIVVFLFFFSQTWTWIHSLIGPNLNGSYFSHKQVDVKFWLSVGDRCWTRFLVKIKHDIGSVTRWYVYTSFWLLSFYYGGRLEHIFKFHHKLAHVNKFLIIIFFSPFPGIIFFFLGLVAACIHTMKKQNDLFSP